MPSLRTAITAALFLPLALACGPQRLRADAPKLIVVLVVDQFRTDYVTRYAHQWTSGLRRVITDGALFTDAAYSAAPTKTCAGHSTIGTGVLPARHGMIDNTWFDRATGRSVACTEDPTVHSIGFGGIESVEHHSAARLLVPPFAEQLRGQSVDPVRVVSMSLKARSAIGLVGAGGPNTYVLWEEGAGKFATSSAYADAPWPVIDDWIQAHPIEQFRLDVWTRFLPPDAYLGDDDAPGELGDRTFPHAFSPSGREADDRFAGRWERSPWSDAYLAGLAEALVASLDLGQRNATDVLAIGFSSLDLVGHDYGPDSHEVQDTLVRLDATIGRLLDTIDRLVGAERYVVALSSDHGVATLPEISVAAGRDGGRVSGTATRRAVQAALEAKIGEGTHVAHVETPFMYFAPEVVERIRSTPALRDVVTQSLLSQPGIGRVYWADELARGVASDDPHLATLARSFVADRSGDVAFIVSPDWVATSTGTTHGTTHWYDTTVPLALAGAGIEPGNYSGRAGPEDIAPTLAYLTGVRLASSDGRVLREALRRRPN